MTLTLARKPVASHQSSSRLDLYGIVPDRLLGMDVPSIAEVLIQVDGHDVPLGAHFDIQDGPRDCLHLTGDLSKADRVGGGMQLGTMTVDSDVGLSLAENMKQGDLCVHGSADDYACSQLRGGRVRISKDVGDYCGAAAPGLRRGMRGGICVVAGKAGRFLGYRMRRGTLYVIGDVGAGCASSLVAGTILIGGRAEAPLGVAMRRGSVLLFQGDAPTLPVGFTPLEPVRLSFLPLLLNEAEPDMPTNCRMAIQSGTWLRCLGDRASEGIGEILWLRPKDEELLQ